MNDDLVKRLLNEAGKDLSEAELHALCEEAAERIKQVEAELIRTHRLMMADAKRVEQLEAALHKIAAIEDEHINIPKTNEGANLWVCLAMCIELAEKALEGKKDV